MLSARCAIAFVVSLLERRAIFALVLVARAVAIVVVVVALAIVLRAGRIETVVVARVITALLESIAVAILRSRRTVRRTRDHYRRGVVRRIGRVHAAARVPVEAF